MSGPLTIIPPSLTVVVAIHRAGISHRLGSLLLYAFLLVLPSSEERTARKVVLVVVVVGVVVVVERLFEVLREAPPVFSVPLQERRYITRHARLPIHEDEQ